MEIKVKSASKSDPGLERANNEDRVHDDPERGIFIVIDGVGGHAAGEKAADIALSKLRTRLERLTGSVTERIHEAITIANNEIHRLAQVQEQWHGMACVLTVAVVEDGQVTIGHVGDTRLYKIHGGQIRKVTHDHSPVGEREDKAELSELEAMRHPRRNEVYRDVGTELHDPSDQDFIELIEIPFESDCALVMCSDGLSDLVTSAQILRIVEEHAANPWEVVKHLIEAANAAGGKDNITALFAAGEQFTAEAQGDDESGGINASTTAEVSLAEALDIVREEPTGKHKRRWQKSLAGQWMREKLSSSWIVLIGGVIAGGLLGIALLSPLPKILKGRWCATGGEVQSLAPQARRLSVGDGGADSSLSIKEALDKASAGDIVEVAPGVYREQVILKEGVNLMSRDPYAAVLRLPEGVAEPRVVIIAERISTGRVSGFKVTGDESSPYDIGLRMVGSNVEVTQLEISGAQIAGIEIDGACAPMISANLIRENSGSGVIIRGEARPLIINNWIMGNGTAVAAAGTRGAAKPGVDIHSPARPLMFGNMIAENGAEGIAGLMIESLESVERKNYFGGGFKANGGGKVRTASSEGDVGQVGGTDAAGARTRATRQHR